MSWRGRGGRGRGFFGRGGFGRGSSLGGPIARDDEGNAIFRGRDEGPPPLFPPVQTLPEYPAVTPAEESLLAVRRRLASAWRYSPYYISRRSTKSGAGHASGHGGGVGPGVGNTLSSLTAYSGLGTSWRRRGWKMGVGGDQSAGREGGAGGSGLGKGVGKKAKELSVASVEAARRRQMGATMNLSVAHFPAELLGPEEGKKARGAEGGAGPADPWAVRHKASAVNDLQRLEELAKKEQAIERAAAKGRTGEGEKGEGEGEDEDEEGEEEDDEEIGADDYAENFGFDDDEDYLDDDDGGADEGATF